VEGTEREREGEEKGESGEKVERKVMKIC